VIIATPDAAVTVTDVLPLPSVVVEAALSVPPPLVIAHVTVAPAIGALAAFSTRTCSGWLTVPVVTVWLSPLIFNNCDGDETTFAVIVTEAPIGIEATSESTPTAPPTVQLVVASPVASVTLVAALTEPPAPTTAHDTVTPASALLF